MQRFYKACNDREWTNHSVYGVLECKDKLWA